MTSERKNLSLCVNLVIALVFLARACLFANTYGSVEHDSGWALGVTKNLAHRGIYGAYTSTVIVNGVGAFPSIHNRFSVQDETGISWFPGGVVVGPGHHFPAALIIKVFGDSWWSYRAWALCASTALLFLLFQLASSWAGVWGSLIVAAWLWATPRFHIEFAYDSLAESTAAMYLVLGLSLFRRCRAQSGRWLYFVTGLFLGLATGTKPITILGCVGFGLFALRDLVTDRHRPKQPILQWSAFVVGVLAPLVFFEIYRAVQLIPRFGVNGWQATLADFAIHFRENGSGLSTQDQDPGLFPSKLAVWKDLSIARYLWVWLLLTVSVIGMGVKLKLRENPEYFLIAATVAVWFFWYFAMSPTGWTRHAWVPLLLSVVILSSAAASLIRRLWRDEGWRWLLPFPLFILLVFDLPRFDLGLVLPPQVVDTWNVLRTERGRSGSPSSAIMPFEEQKQVIKFFSSEVKAADRIYYVGGYLVAEISALVDRVFYPLARFEHIGDRGAEVGRSLMIMGPFQIGHWPWRLTAAGYEKEWSGRMCKRPLFANRTYFICEL